MKLLTVIVPKYAFTKRGAMRRAEGSACRIFEKTIAKYLKEGFTFKTAMVAPVKIERNWFKFWIHYEVIATIDTKKPYKKETPKKEPNCKVKSCKKVKGKSKKKVYKK